jgi:hypothetical protein
MSREKYLAYGILILVAAAFLRTIWMRADPPTGSVGIVWHDEGAWTHNARNRVLWGEWRTDNWNPVFVAPVFTALEYAAFETLGVGTWQARTVPAASGIVAVGALMLGLSALWGARTRAIGFRAAVLGGLLLAFDFTWTMWNRAALMESTMTAFMVCAWAAYAMSARRPLWGFVAGVATVLAWFTKAAAAFFVVAVVADVMWVLITHAVPRLREKLNVSAPEPANVRAAWFAILGLSTATAVFMFVLVIPHWSDYQFYNWQMSVLRKPSYDLRSLIDRASWLPIVQDFFARMWLVLLGAAIAIAGIVARWRDARPAERLLVLWMVIGLLELAVHDSGTERRYVMFLPAIIALASGLAATGSPWLPSALAGAGWTTRLAAAPLIALLAYIVVGSALRWVFQDQVAAGQFKIAVRSAATASIVLVGVVLAFWPSVVTWLSVRRIPLRIAGVLTFLVIAWNIGQFGGWAKYHRELNYKASVALGALLPPGTLVHGKLANGMALENFIRPIFIGNQFGNYADRLSRDDARYILTYGLPEIGRESGHNSGLIKEILDHYPNWRRIATFDVDETRDRDQAWLIDKLPGTSSSGPAPPAPASGSNRAPD